jgi:hypothetical protein
MHTTKLFNILVRSRLLKIEGVVINDWHPRAVHIRHKHRSMVHDVFGFGHSRAMTLRKLSQDLNLEGNSEFPNVLVVIL